jgi:hypothetical protein
MVDGSGESAGSGAAGAAAASADQSGPPPGQAHLVRHVVTVGVLVCVALGLIVFTAMAFVGSSPSTVAFAASNGRPLQLRVQTVGTIGFGPHPTWVSYLVQSPSGAWVHTTIWQLPAHTRVDVTVDEYDTGGPLRNPAIGSVFGVQDPTLNGKTYTLIDASSGNGVAHTFSIPQLGINVPLAAVNANAANQCSTAPCSTKQAHNVITFSFTTGDPGTYPWQCFLPCGLGYLYGNGGPMQTLGYMDGFLEIR